MAAKGAMLDFYATARIESGNATTDDYNAHFLKAKGQSDKDAIDKAQKIVNDSLKMANEMKTLSEQQAKKNADASIIMYAVGALRLDLYNAEYIHYLAVAMHTIMDSTSPAHCKNNCPLEYNEENKKKHSTPTSD